MKFKSRTVQVTPKPQASGGQTMKQPSEAAIRLAVELVNRQEREDRGVAKWEIEDVEDWPTLKTLARYIDEVSKTAKACLSAPYLGPERTQRLKSLILPDEPDPLSELIEQMWEKNDGDIMADAAWLRAELAKRGLKIVETGDE